MTITKKTAKNSLTNKINCQKIFGFDVGFEVFGFEDKSNLVPKIDENYVFDIGTTKAILAGLMFGQKTLLQGMHGTGKSTHIEQVCARLNWQVLRVNFDSQITRLDLVGKDVITLKDGKQITEFKRGIIPFTLTRPITLVLDEYDAIRTDVSFVIQRLLEEEGKFALLEENEILSPHEHFRLFATSNTIGMGDDLGIYHGTNLINQAQMDRWNIVATLNYLSEEKEIEILLKKLPFLAKKSNENVAKMMVRMASLTREGFRNGDLSNLMSLRTLISWGKNFEIFGDLKQAFILSFLNKLIEEEKLILQEYYQRIFA
ncbi:MAG: cobaltochelatase CobS [Rickettsiales bacterium]|jgi:cobaltochelatase CobS